MYDGTYEEGAGMFTTAGGGGGVQYEGVTTRV